MIELLATPAPMPVDSNAMLEFVKHYGIPSVLLLVAAWITWHWYSRVKVPHQQKMNNLAVDKEKSSIALQDALANQLPAMQASQNETCEAVRQLHDRHTTHDEHLVQHGEQLNHHGSRLDEINRHLEDIRHNCGRTAQ